MANAAPENAGSIVAFPSGQTPSQRIRVDRQTSRSVVASFFFLFFFAFPFLLLLHTAHCLFPLPSVRRWGGSRGAWLLGIRALNVIRAHLCDVPIEG